MERRYFYRFAFRVRVPGHRSAAGMFRFHRVFERHGLDPSIRGQLDRQLGWFDEGLPAPKEFRHGAAIFWFKPDAGEPLRRMRRIAAWLRAQGVDVVNLRTHAPGQIVYEDPWQIAARPDERTNLGLQPGRRRSRR